MYTLHIANKNYSSWSLRPWVLMKALNIPFQEIMHPFGEGSNWGEFRKFSPTGLVPCLVDGDRCVWDSLGIMEYLAERHAGVWPESDDARAWARCAAAEMHSGFSVLRDVCPMNCGVMVAMTTRPAGLDNNLERLEELWSQGLSRFSGPFLGGKQFTAVDAFYVPVAFRARTFQLQLSQQSQAYVNELLSLDAVKTWEKSALNETWRESGHEADTVRFGKILEDNRIK
ncbi:glutathione S-transferase [Pseudohongiella nitratireducens]|uniref:Glutathione S-transferase n=1 Tax=Pseudohongiella nitratireducens TaxID=1768907 RepID=A0A916VJT6_9GAMM|nr:glutathione S-transferase [Pseudohongiella nitratireducens]GFZ80175.1 glutathione S-transferase [Pseudohongiella nitratireducens]